MADRTDRKISDARMVAMVLEGQGRHADAKAVLDLAKAHTAMRETCRRLYHDNMALRNAAGLPPMEP
jgi:nucleoside diphosphate kinase